MFTIRIADITVKIHNRFGYVERLCRNYIVPDGAADLEISVPEEDIRAEMAQAEVPSTPGYAEGICVYRMICRQLPYKFDSYLFHSAVIEYEGEGYAFAAKSGTGKSTHVSLWQKRFGDAVHIVNGDKPILRFVNDRLYAYGTPWCGKEGYEENTSVPLRAICFLERAKENSIRRIEPEDAVMRIFQQILTPGDLQTVDALFPLLDRTLREVPVYVLGCNISEEAAEVAYSGMNRENISESGKKE